MTTVSASRRRYEADARDTLVSRRLLNLGCGGRFHAAWTNLDAAPQSTSVIRHDVTQRLPFADRTFEFVYHSHLLEHLTPEQGAALLRECHRVLTPGGTIRVVVPDLEAIARLYLHALEKARAGDEQWRHNYDWMLIELLDQTVRERSGGRHGTFLNRDDIPNVDFVIARHGQEARASIEGQRARRLAEQQRASAASPRRSPLRRWVRPLRDFVREARRASLRSAVAQSLLGAEREWLELGRFRRQGEIHQWMYDDYSLSRLLVESGFENPVRRDAAHSHVPGWLAYELDTDAHGQVHKPDSVFVEATKPVEATTTPAGRRG
jgi:SAM-dependent methyltransferase